MRAVAILYLINVGVSLALASYDYHDNQSDEFPERRPTPESYAQATEAKFINPLGYNNCDKGSLRGDPLKVYDNFKCDKRRSSANVQLEGRRASLRIEHGFEARLGEFPSFIQLEIVREKTRVTCGGTLLNEFLVLTAAHCVEGARVIKVRGGTIKYRPAENVRHQSSAAIKYCRPVDWDKLGLNSSYSYDWAILELKDEFKYNEHLQPGCVNLDFELKPELLCIAVGFGRRYYDQEEDTEDLRAAVLMSECPKRYEDVYNRENLQCFIPAPLPGRGQICKGDSGGPLYCFENCSGKPKMYSIGIAHATLFHSQSSNHSCGYHKPAYFTTTLSQRYPIALTIRQLIKHRQRRVKRLSMIPGTFDGIKTSPIQCNRLDPPKH